MIKHAKHGQKYSGASRQEIASLLQALNGAWPYRNQSLSRHLLLVVPDAVRLARIVLKLQSLVAKPPIIKLSDSTVKDARDQLTTVKDIRDYIRIPAARHLAQLNSALARYNSFPCIGTDLRGNWEFKWSVQARGSGNEDRGVFDLTAQDELPLVLTAIRLAEQGLIDRVRRCPIDRRWFYARTQESRFCRDKCRDTFHQKDPARKAQRREWARKNYQSRKELELGSRKATKNAKERMRRRHARLQTR